MLSHVTFNVYLFDINELACSETFSGDSFSAKAMFPLLNLFEGQTIDESDCTEKECTSS